MRFVLLPGRRFDTIGVTDFVAGASLGAPIDGSVAAIINLAAAVIMTR